MRLSSLLDRTVLTAEQAAELLDQVQTRGNEAPRLVFLTVYALREASWDEWQAFARVWGAGRSGLSFADKEVVYDRIALPGSQDAALSLAVCFVLAALDVPIAKWGDSGYGAGAGCSDILEHLGLDLEGGAEQARAQMQRCNFAYLHAPAYCPSLHAWADARRALGLGSVIDAVLPLLHPAADVCPLLAVPDTERLRLYRHWYAQQNLPFMALSDGSGSANLSLRAPFLWLDAQGRESLLRLDETDLPVLPAADTKTPPSGIAGQARRLWTILSEAADDVALLQTIANAAWQLHAIRPQTTLNGCLAECEAALSSGRALQVLERLLE